nr:MAG TPA: hypothetical protein [Caudoviricetes sp.]
MLPHSCFCIYICIYIIDKIFLVWAFYLSLTS